MAATYSDAPIFGNKLGGMKDVYIEPFDSVVEVNNRSFETQVGAALHDTEVLHDVDSAENSEAQMLDGYDTEVVPDSDDEVTDVVERNGLSRRSGDFVDIVPPSFSSCKQQRPPVVDIAACADSRHVSGQSTYVIECKGNDNSPVTVQSKIQATEMHFKDSGLSRVKDADLVNSVSCAVFTDNIKQQSEGVKFDCDVKTNQWKMREVHVVYTRKRKRASCPLRDKVEQEEPRTPNTNIECAGLSYVDSQEPEDLSKALLFVDEYVSVSAVNSSPMGNVNVKNRSPTMSRAKGIQSVVRWTKLRDTLEETGIFEWGQSQETVGKSDSFGNSDLLSFPGSKYGKIYVRRSPDLKNVISKKHGNPGIFCNEKIESFNHNHMPRDLTHLNAKLAVSNSEAAGETKEVNKRKAGNHFDAELDLKGRGECPIMQLETGAVHKELEDNFDVGIDTQIAAEAIQELSFAAPAGFSDIDADQCPKSLGGTERKNDAGVWPFHKQACSDSGRIVSQPIDNRNFLCSENKEKRGKILELEKRKNGKKSTKKCLYGRSFEDCSKAKVTKKTKIMRAMGPNTNNFEENLGSFVLDEDLPLCKLKRGRKQRHISPLFGSLKLPNSLNMYEGLMNESRERKIDHMKVLLQDKRKEPGTNDNTLRVSAALENHSSLLREKSRDSGSINVSKEDGTYPILCEPAVNISGDVKIHLWEFNLHDNDNEGSIGANMREVSSLIDKSWLLVDYSKGKRICRKVLRHSEGSSGVDYSYAKLRTERANHSSLRSQFNSDGLLNPSSFGSYVKRKQRSSVYINPCWYSSKENHNETVQSCSIDVSRQKQIYDGSPVVENKQQTYDGAPVSEKNQSTSEQLIDRGSAGQLDQASKSNKDFACTLDGAIRVNNPELMPHKNLKSHELDHVFMYPNNTSLTDETNFVNMINGCREQAAKRKASLSPLTRELVRLGCNESIPEFNSKDSRKRKTMANIRVLFSQNLAKGTLKQQKKILARLGVPMVSCPSAATHFIADKFARTRNMLEFVAQGKPVVTHMWLESCDQAGCYIDERNYILRDVKKEQEIGFKLPLSLDQARHPLLKGFRVFVTPNTQPGQELLTSLIKAAHGQAVDSIIDCQRIPLSDLLILSCEEDKDYCGLFLKKGAKVYSPELILNGIIIQKLEFERHRLFTKHVKRH